MKTISFKNSDLVCLVDDEDLEILSKFRWYLSMKNRVFTIMDRPGVVTIHRFLMNPPDDLIIDHKDHNPLNNQRDNLRICTWRNNNQNTRKRKSPTSSIFKGVYFNPKYRGHNKYRAHISKEKNKPMHIGCFPDEISAAKAYNDAAIEYFGEFAQLNVIPD